MPFNKLTSKGTECDDAEDESLKKKLLEEKAKRRLALREIFLKEKSDPFKHASGQGETVFDPAIQRYIAMKVSNYTYFKPTVTNAFLAITMMVLPMAGLGYCIQKQRGDREKSFRSGKVAYKDRLMKLI